jgi:hypothetical protein
MSVLYRRIDMNIEKFKIVSMIGVLILAGSIAKMMMPVMSSMPLA